MKLRLPLTCELERHVDEEGENQGEEPGTAWRRSLIVPLQSIPVKSGKEGNEATVGTLKAIVRLKRGGDTGKSEQEATEDKDLEPKEYVVRVYVLEARYLTPQDADGSDSDPYLRLVLGDQTRDTRHDYKPNCSDPKFHTMF